MATVAPVDEEEVIKKRFLTQTTVTRGEPPLRRLAQRYLQFTQAVTEGQAGKAADLHAGLLRDLAQIQASGTRQAATCAANAREQAAYVEKRAALEADIAQAHRDIAQRREELAAARIQKAHNEQYEALRKQIMKHPKRATSAANKAALEQEIEAVRAEGVAIGRLIDRRREQIQAVLGSLDQLAATFQADDAGGAAPMAIG